MNHIDLLSAVKLMGQGMVGIFIVMAAISLMVYLFSRLAKETKK